MDVIYKFVFWFICSIVGTFFLTIIFPNKILLSFVVATIISVLAIKNDF